jgi:hypothetical protein
MLMVTHVSFQGTRLTETARFSGNKELKKKYIFIPKKCQLRIFNLRVAMRETCGRLFYHLAGREVQYLKADVADCGSLTRRYCHRLFMQYGGARDRI